MKNLENAEIFSDKLLNAVSIISDKIPHVVFGGSIALNAIGLITRPISDIDMFFDLNENLSKTGIFNILNDYQCMSETLTTTNGIEVKRVAINIAGVKGCCFKVPSEQLQCSKYYFYRNGKQYSINIQNVNYAIEAKRSYSKKNIKHTLDLIEINNELNNIFN